jgi:predicted MFS family arabinose efflux permease
MSTNTIISPASIRAEQAGIPAVSSRLLGITYLILFLATFLSGILSMLMSVLLPVAVTDLLGNVPEKELNDASAWINAVFIFGWMFGGLLWGVIGDKIGRSRSLALSIASFGLFGLLTAMCNSWLQVSICRFFTGFGIGGLLVLSSVLVTELWSEKKKSVVMGIVSLAMPVGFFAAGAINNFTEGWRAPFLLSVSPLVLGIVAWFVLPESADWEKVKKTAKNVSNKLAPKMPAGYRTNLLVGSIVFGTMLIGLWAIFSWAPTWIQTVSSTDNAQQGRGTLMMIMAGGGIVGSFASGWIVNAAGLRKTIRACFAVCFIMSFVIFKLTTTLSILTYLELIILAFFFGISQGAFAIYIPSLFPPAVCGTATGFCFNVGRLFTGTVVFFIGSLVTILGGYGNAIFIFSFIFIIGLISTYFRITETTKVPG